MKRLFLAFFLIPCMAFADFASTILGTQSASLKGYWKLDETSGTSLTDSSGNANTLTLTGTPATDYNLNQTGEQGAAIQFLGAAGYGEKTSNIIASNMQSQDFTIFALIKTTATAAGTVAGLSDPGTFNRILLQTTSGGALKGYAERGGDATYQPSGGTINDGTWHDVCFTRSGNTWTIYIDASSAGTASGGFAGGLTIGRTNTGTNHDASGPREAFNGYLQHVAMWSVALSGSEITAIHDARTATAATTARSKFFFGP